MRCRECDGAQLVYDDVGSLVCTNCGTLADPTQAVLADHNDHPTTASYSRAPRTSKGWHLAQTKQDRDRKNAIAMSTFISSVLSRLNNPGLSPRAEAIFTQAMANGHYRWGRRAKLVAGASMAIALREARKSDSLRDIAFLLDDSTLSLSRAFQSVLSLLDFSLASTDPAVHLPILHAYLQPIIHPDPSSPAPPSQLPRSLLSVLAPLSLQTAVRTATSLSQIILDHSPPLPLAHLPTPPTACALLILGLEAEGRAPLPHLGELTRTLGTRFALAHGVVSSRYKILYDLIEEWIRHVPWLNHFVSKHHARGPTARSKMPKRAVVARGIKDVIQFHEQIWFSRMQNQEKVKLDLELDASDFAIGEAEDQGVNPLMVASSSSSRNVAASAVEPPLGKRRKVERKGDAIQTAYQLSTDPLSSRAALDAATSNGETSLLTHLLTCSPEELARARGTPPTRLQLLAASRGGSTEAIADEELFAVGELEGLLRTEQEREALRPLFRLNWGEDVSDEPGTVCRPNTPPIETTKRGAKRIDMDALTRLLGEGIDGDSTDDVDVGSLDAEDASRWGRHSSGYEIATDDAELVSDWQPISPDDREDEFGAFRHRSVDDRYDEEI